MTGMCSIHVAQGAAAGFVYSAAVSAAYGWGVAYLVIGCVALVMIAVPASWLPDIDSSAQKANLPGTTLNYETCTIICSWSQILFWAGQAGAAGGLQGLQVFLPNIAVLMGFWEDEVTAAASFGAGIVIGALVGGPAIAIIAERFTSGVGRDDETKTLLVLTGSTTFAAILCSSIMDVALLQRLTLLGDVTIPFVGALLLGTLGLQTRLPLLLVPTVGLQPLSLLLSNLAASVGSTSGPLLAGAIKDCLAPLCSTAADGTVDPRCFTSRPNQWGLVNVVIVVQVLTLLAGIFWTIAGLIPTGATCMKRKGNYPIGGVGLL